MLPAGSLNQAMKGPPARLMPFSSWLLSMGPIRTRGIDAGGTVNSSLATR
jgi:hypothetical protein